MEKYKLVEMETYPDSITIIGKTDNGRYKGFEINCIKEQAGLYTEEEWRQEVPICLFDRESQQEILRHLSLFTNSDFFREEEE